MEGTFLTLAFGALAAIPAAIHLALMPCGDRHGLTAALIRERNKGHVWIHDLVIAAEVDTPRIRMQSALCHGPVAGLANQLSWIPFATVPDVQSSFEKLCTWLGWIQWAGWVWIMKIVQVLSAHCSLVVFVSCVRTLWPQHIKHLLCTERRSVWEGLIDFLGHVALFLLSLRRLVLTQVRNVVGKKIQQTLDAPSRLSTSMRPAFLSAVTLSYI